MKDSMVNYNYEDLKDHFAVAGVIKNEKGEILMMDHVKFDFWTLPVGKVKDNETVEEGLMNELFEELGIKVIEYKVLNSFDKVYLRRGNIVKVICYIMDILVYENEIYNKEPEKHRSLKWMSVEEISDLERISDPTREYLKLI